MSDVGWRNPAGREVSRFIAVPTSVSEQAQQFLGMDMFGAAGRMAPTDIAGWQALIKETDELLVAVMGAQVEHLRTTVQSKSVGGVPVFVVSPEGVDEGDTKPIYLDVHGGSPALTMAQVQPRQWADQP